MLVDPAPSPPSPHALTQVDSLLDIESASNMEVLLEHLGHRFLVDIHSAAQRYRPDRV